MLTPNSHSCNVVLVRHGNDNYKGVEMDDFLSISGARTTFDNAVSAALRGNWALVDSLASRLAESTGQGDFDVVYGAVYAAYLERK